MHNIEPDGKAPENEIEYCHEAKKKLVQLDYLNKVIKIFSCKSQIFPVKFPKV